MEGLIWRILRRVEACIFRQWWPYRVLTVSLLQIDPNLEILKHLGSITTCLRANLDSALSLLQKPESDKYDLIST